MDYFKEIGNLAMASRLKRLTGWMFMDASHLYEEAGLDFEPQWFPVFYLLHTRNKPLTITEIANYLDLSHPAIIKITNAMKKSGLLRSLKDKHDGRKHMLDISKKGREACAKLLPLWESFEESLEEFSAEVGYDLLDVIEKMETAITRKPMKKRISDNIKKRQHMQIEIVEYRPELKEHFYKLNAEWLEKYFSVEEADRKLLLNPEEEIIDRGGAVFFALSDNKAVGTCALIKLSDNSFEMAKMGVTEEYQGKQAGRKLTETAIRYARDHGAGKLFLKTDKKLNRGIQLYRKMGFVIAQKHPFSAPVYEREKGGVIMELNLTRGGKV